LLAIVFIVVVISGICYYKRKQLHAFIIAENHWEYLKQHWPYTPLKTVLLIALLLLVCVSAVLAIMYLPLGALDRLKGG
jgi:uncharacterized membrane protein